MTEEIPGQDPLEAELPAPSRVADPDPDGATIEPNVIVDHADTPTPDEAPAEAEPGTEDPPAGAEVDGEHDELGEHLPE